MWKIILAVGLGGFLGSVGRYFAGVFIQGRMGEGWPAGTFAVNVLGCLLIGAIFVLAERIPLNQEWRLFLAIGFCGGLTTFSSFSFEIFNLLRTGQSQVAFYYVVLSVLFGLAGVWAGMALMRLFWPAGEG